MKFKIFTIIIFTFLITTSVTFPQIRDEIENLRTRTKITGPKYREPYLYQEQKYSQEQAYPAETVVLETSIDPADYVVGPGDGLAINIWSEANLSFELIITPECKLLIPTVTDIDLNDLTLAEAKQKIVAAVKEKYINSEVSVNLISLRQFRVTVSGQVENPGAVIVSAADRVSDAINLANQLTKIQEEEEKEKEPIIETVSGKEALIPLVVKKEPCKRLIILTRKNGEKIQVDLLGYEITGAKEKNPYLLEGDVIYVPLFSKNVPTVEILGAIHQAGVYELMENDRVMDIIKIAHDFTYNADQSNIEISRFNSDNKTTTSFKIDLSENTKTNGEFEKNNVKLKVDDRIYVRYIPEYHRKNTVEIKGEIRYPGFYTVELGKTRLSDIVKAAGGFTDNASLRESFVIRRIYEESEDAEYERLAKMTVNEMTSIEREYYKMKSRERKGRIAVDFIKLFVEKDSTKDILLNDDDYIEIAAKGRIVTVSGKVVRPGIISFEEGKKVPYYIKKAGGFSWNANKLSVRIIRGETGDWINAHEDTKVYVGDTIFIPEKSKIEWWTIIKDAVQIAYQIAALILFVQSAMNN